MMLGSDSVRIADFCKILHISAIFYPQVLLKPRLCGPSVWCGKTQLNNQYSSVWPWATHVHIMLNFL